MRNARERTIQAFVALRLLEKGLTQAEAAKTLGISPPQLGRDIKNLDHYMEIKKVFREELLQQDHPGIYDEVMSFDLTDELDDSLQEQFEHAPTVRTFSLNSGSIAARLDEFAAPAADYIGQLLTRSKLVGLTWGGTIASIAKRTRPNPRQKRPIRFLPLCGEAPRSENFALYSSSTLALRFHESFNSGFARQPRIHSLASVPMMLPSGLDSEVREIVRRVFQGQSVAYEEIFGPAGADAPKRLIDSVDTMITGVGSHKHPYGYINDDYFKIHTSLTRENIRTLVYGDVAGHLLPRPEIPSETKKDIERLNEAILGVQLSDIKRCAERARKTKQPGVVIVAISRRKAKAILSLIEMGAVNILVCDSSLKSAMGAQMRGRLRAKN